MDTFKTLNGQIAYAKVKSKTAALDLRDKAKETTLGGKNVVVFFGKRSRHHLYLAPGQDPYQVRKDIDAFLNAPKSKPKSKTESKPKTESEPNNTPPRGPGGKFISASALKESKEHSILEPDPPTSSEPPKKKGIFGF